uniref:Uncharacterized protein n=1 Tax=Oryza sativa subsp. japonica TaxID=39947 RepID=Q6ESN5_ORYSJ|nr:unknown protein [Oryza sativa Japonica Group]
MSLQTPKNKVRVSQTVGARVTAPRRRLPRYLYYRIPTEGDLLSNGEDEHEVGLGGTAVIGRHAGGEPAIGRRIQPHARDDHLKLKAKKDKAEMINYDALPKLKAKKDKPYKGRSCANAGSEKCVQG